MPFGQSAKLIEKGDLDATLQSAGLGVDSIRQLGTSVAINFVEIPKDVVIQINEVALPVARFLVSTSAALDADKLTSLH